jgi:hypothetical protein
VVVLLGSTGRTLVRAEESTDGWRVDTVLEGRDVRCLVHDPLDPRVAYAGTQGEGLLRSDDAGRTWRAVGPVTRW